MTCKSVESRLSAYLDGELTGQEMFCIRDHLNRCFECREEAASLKGLKRLIGAIECPEPPRDFEARLVATVICGRHPKASIPTYQSAILFTGVAAATMFVTLQFLGAFNHPSVAVTQPRAPFAGPTMDVEVRSDAMASAISDPISGAPVWSAVDSR